MIPSATRVALGLAFTARRHGWMLDELDVVAFEAALAHARELATGSEQDEPAALLYAIALRPEVLPSAWRTVAGTLAIGHAAQLGLILAPPPGALDSFCTKIAAGEATFRDVQRWFAEQMKPAE